VGAAWYYELWAQEIPALVPFASNLKVRTKKMTSMKWHEDFTQQQIATAVKNEINGAIFTTWTYRGGWEYRTNHCLYEVFNNFITVSRGILSDMYGSPIACIIKN
jgi:hypothetical protein